VCRATAGAGSDGSTPLCAEVGEKGKQSVKRRKKSVKRRRTRSRSGRIAGLDVAGALAVFGLPGAHLGAVADDVGRVRSVPDG
jgi:hypothetical protein